MKIGKWPGLAGAVVVSLLVAVTLMSGCGGDDDGNGGGGGAAESPDEYAKQVCETLGDRFNELDRLMEGSDFEDPEQLREAIDEARPVLEDLSNDLDDIDPPAEVEEWHDSMVSALSQASELFGKLGDVLDKPLDEAMGALEELMPELEEMQTAFAGVGELPQEYQDAFENEPACADLELLSE
ncbi:MAG: hypothetical protein QME71_00405 [Dehalococcoidia bacterium]|nr:hypothetical protein [Dehalococcoidia bacterium]